MVRLIRRRFLGASLSFAVAAILRTLPAKAVTAPVSRVRPGMPGWPTEADWASLKEAVGGRLSPVPPPDFDDAAVRQLLSDPFYVGDQPGLTQSSGWLDAWRSSPGAYVVAAESASDVAAAIRFARARNIRLMARGGGHSYLGASNAPDSLLVWTRKMNAITVHGAFTPQGSSATPVPAVSAGAGFGQFSKAYGTVAASLLEAEIVTADGRTRIVNAGQEPDLFWALKGGGGGTFGVITRVTLATHELPETFGAVRLALRARSDEAYRRLLARFVDLYATSLFNPHWGEKVTIRPDNRLEVQMLFQGLTQDDARAAWKPLIDFANDHSADYDGQDSLIALALPARYFWDPDFYRRNAPAAVRFDSRPGASPSDFWWTGDGDQVGAFWYAYASAWLPAALLQPQNQARLVDAWFAASRHWGFEIVFNKGLAGAPAAAIDAARNTAMNPDVLDAFALAITAASGPPTYPGFRAPSLAAAGALRSRVQATMAELRAAAPDTGAYVNECDYFQTDWQRAFWGPNYPRLSEIKRRYDSDGLFTVHHGVGSESWSPDGFTKLP
jgi:FAD/FMN-containing dehydrogenase